MKRIFLFTAILALALGASARPVLTWLQTTADFGDFAESNGPAIAVFRAVNTGPRYPTGGTASDRNREHSGHPAHRGSAHHPNGFPGRGSC